MRFENEDLDPTPLKRQRMHPNTVATDESSKDKPKQVKDKRKKKRETKILSGKKNLLSTAGLVGLGAVFNYLGQSGNN